MASVTVGLSPPTEDDKVAFRTAFGIPMTAGKSAYEAAVYNGYVGTEVQWLASLKGATGPTGSTGKSAYQIAVDNGFTGTVEEWLTSLAEAGFNWASTNW